MSNVASSTGRLLMIMGIVFFVFGALLASGWKIPLGRLPGDIVIERPGGAFYFPIVTCLLLSLLLSLIAWLLRR
jgi:Protein of unknown function (DUF2905)